MVVAMMMKVTATCLPGLRRTGRQARWRRDLARLARRSGASAGSRDRGDRASRPASASRAGRRHASGTCGTCSRCARSRAGSRGGRAECVAGSGAVHRDRAGPLAVLGADAGGLVEAVGAGRCSAPVLRRRSWPAWTEPARRAPEQAVAARLPAPDAASDEYEAVLLEPLIETVLVPPDRRVAAGAAGHAEAAGLADDPAVALCGTAWPRAGTGSDTGRRG